MEFIESITKDIFEIFKSSAQKIRRKVRYHNFIQYHLVRLAEKYNLLGGREYKIPNYKGDHRNGSLDIAWIDPKNRKIIAIFEIDSSLREKSVNKLIYLFNIPHRFWIYYGHINKNKVREFLKTNDPDGLIKLITYDKLLFTN